MQEFLDAIISAADYYVTDPNGKESLTKIRAALQTPSKMSDGAGAQLPIRDSLEEVAIPSHFHAPELRQLVETFLRLELCSIGVDGQVICLARAQTLQRAMQTQT